MSFYLFIAATIGLTLFILTYFLIVAASFRHHPVTGLIALLPGINLTVLPTIWSKSGKTFLIGLLGLGTALITWYSGGNRYFQEQRVTGTPSISELSPAHEKKPAAAALPQNFKETPLPEKPLYYLVYHKVDNTKLTSLVGQQVRLTLTNGQQMEGKGIKASRQALMLETTERGNTQVLKISPQHIQTLEKLIPVQN